VILDFGCGQDATSKLCGIRPHGYRLEEQPAFCMARAKHRLRGMEQISTGLDLPGERFDAIFANASSSMCRPKNCPRVLRQLHVALKPGGRAVQLQSARPERGRLEPRALRRLPRSEAWRRYMLDAAFIELDITIGDGITPRTATVAGDVWRRPPP